MGRKGRRTVFIAIGCFQGDVGRRERDTGGLDRHHGLVSMQTNLRFPRPFRIRSGKTFTRIYREGRRARGSQIIVVGAPNGLQHPRLGLSVGKRIWKSAVKRNRVRRVFREAFRLAAPDLPPLDLVLIPAEPKLRPTTAEATRELKRLARKVQGKLHAAAQVSPTVSRADVPPRRNKSAREEGRPERRGNSGEA